MTSKTDINACVQQQSYAISLSQNLLDELWRDAGRHQAAWRSRAALGQPDQPRASAATRVKDR
ncbi:hypothetical protein [Streptomyces tendae]|uniref:hypothetical protein n=1 Tax=Streptomyces tendae TaxID=1932 RepID=UPI0037B5AECE